MYVFMHACTQVCAFQRAEVTGSCEPPSGSGNQGLLEGQPVLLTAKSSLQTTYSASYVSSGNSNSAPH